jgi:hypothetical protein
LNPFLARHPRAIKAVVSRQSSVRILEPWNPGTLEQWNPGTLEQWNPGTLEHWNPKKHLVVTINFCILRYANKHNINDH